MIYVVKKNHKIIKTLNENDFKFVDVYFSSNNNYICITYNNEFLLLEENYQNKYTIKNYFKSCDKFLCFSPCENYIMFTNKKNYVSRFNLKNETIQKKIVIHDKKIINCCYSYLGEMLVSADCDGSVKIWNSETYELIAQVDVQDYDKLRIHNNSLHLFLASKHSLLIKKINKLLH
ncbi:hypothetical protein QLL95_gp0572 [Cotonvirus japonicus]|uniref:Uncharacterized protein n=1 Tax=Cotonvirus japonicus TaxID=2811091 RepID=A0ABM7NTY1_9VIRU|nr:hypothetical protein QLL95_gp0572 [Cotonvirus japonicus]BCS83551.1 hypothetical protein [Cotonvirus japonicus]